MNVFDLYASISLDTDAYEKGLAAAKKESESFSSKFKTAFSNAAKIGTAFTAVVGTIGTAVSVLGIEAAADAKALESQFSQTFGDMATSAEEAVSRVADASGIIDTRLKESASSIYAFARSSGGEVEESMSLMETALQAAADSAAYYDTTIEQATETLQSFLKGNYENDAALGLSATETTRNAAAMELFGQKFNDLTEIQKQQTLLKMVTDAQELSGAMGQAAREADGWANITGNLSQAWTDFKAAIGGPLLEQVTPIIQNITTAMQDLMEQIDWNAWADAVSNGVDSVKNLMETVEAIAPVLAVAAGGLAAFKAGMAIQTAVQGFQTARVAVSLLALEIGKTNLAQAALNGTMTIGQTIVALLTGQMSLATLAQGAMTKAQAALNAVLNANPIAIVITVVGLLVTAIVTLWTTNEDFRNAVITIWENIKQTFSDAWEAIKETFSKWGEFFTGKWEELKNVFSNAWEAFKEIGSNIVDGIEQGISDAWEGLKNWFNGIWNSLFGGRNVNVNVNGTSNVAVDGSHAGGLDYVPFDGYLARLHRGEMVLTENEAGEYRVSNAKILSRIDALTGAFLAGNNSGGVFEIHVDIDGQTAAMALFDPLKGVIAQRGEALA